MNNKEYTPFGDEWEKEILRMNKKDIMQLFKASAVSKIKQKQMLIDAIREEIMDKTDFLETYSIYDPKKREPLKGEIRGLERSLELIEGIL